MRSFQFISQELTKRIEIARDAVPNDKMIETNVPADTSKEERIIGFLKTDIKFHSDASFAEKYTIQDKERQGETMKLLTMEEAAEAMSVSVNTVRSLLPRLGAVDLRGGRGTNRLIRIPEENIAAYIRECRIMAPVSMKEVRERTRADAKPFKLERRRA